MYDFGFNNITNIDISSEVISQMENNHKETSMKCIVVFKERANYGRNQNGFFK